jgi:predicted nucleic acid-binding protein
VTAVDAVLVDTDVFSVVFVRENNTESRLSGWREDLRDRRVVISFQTRAEMLAGARMRGWGETSTARLRRILDGTPTVHDDIEVIDAYAVLTAACRASGHALHDKRHTADRWIAACAIAKGLPLLAGDGIYQTVPGLTLL